MNTLSLQSPQDMQSAIAFNPLIVPPDTTVRNAIVKMGETGSNYVLVAESTHPESNSLVGILTERDIVRISTQPIPLDQLLVEAVMSHPVITIKASIFTDISVALTLFQQHQIRHLPVLDDRDRLVGLLAQDTLIEMLTQKVLQLESEREMRANISKLEKGEVVLQQINQDLEKQVELGTAALQVSEATNRTMLEAIPDLLLRLQRDGTCSDYVKQRVGNENFLPIVNHIAEILPPELLQKQLETIEQAIATGDLQVYEHSFLRQDRMIHEEVRILAINDQEVLAIIRDISDRKLSEEDLHLSDERLQLVLGIAGDGLWDWNVSTGAVYLSPQWLAMLGFNPDDLPANITTWEQLIHPDDISWVRERLNAHFQDDNASYKFDYRLQTKTGEYCWISNYGKAVVRDQQGKPLRMIGTHRDITSRKQAEAQLYKSDVHLRMAQRIGKLGSWEFELLTGEISWSEEVFRIYGRDPAMDAPTYEKLQQYIHPEDWEHFDQTLQTAIALVQPYDLEYRIRHPDGSLGYVISRAEIICDDLGQPIQLIGTILDVTNLKQAEAALRQLNQDLEHRVESRTASLQRNEARLREAQQVAHVGDWELDLLNQKLSLSPEVFKIFGLDPDQPEPTYEEMLSYYPLDERKRIIDFVDKAIQGEPYETDFQIIRADGSFVYIFARTEPILDAAGQVIKLFGIVMDISDRKVIQEALERSEERIRATLLALPDLVFRVNRDGQYMDFLTPPQGKNLVDPDQSHGKTIYDDLPSDIMPNHAETKYLALQQAIITQTVQSYEQQVWIEGSLRDEEVRVAPCGKDEAVFVVRDISDRKQSEQFLLESQQFIQTVVDTLPLPMFWKDRVSVYLGCNKQFAKILNMSSTTEIVGKTDFDLSWTEDEAIACREDDQWVVESGQSKLGFEEMLTKPSGEQIWIETHKAPIRDWTNNVVGVVGMFQDVTDRKQAELRLRQQAEQAHLLGTITQRMRSSLNLAEILKSTVEEVHQILQSDRVLVFRVLPNRSGTINAESISPNWPKILNSGFPEDLIPQDRYDLYLQGKEFVFCDLDTDNDSLFPRLVEFYVKIQVKAAIVVPIIQEQTLWGLLVTHQCDRPRHWQEWEINLLQQTANQLAIAIQHASLFEQSQIELAERQRAEARLIETNDQLAISNAQLARATRIKDEFLANMSHELRTPLNAILGMTEALQEAVFGIVNQQQITALQTVERSGSHLLELINDILDVAKIESGNIELECAPTSINSLCQSSIAFIKHQAFQKQIQIDIKLPDNLPDLLVDERRIRQVLINLLSNAVKFTPEGGQIILEVSRLSCDTVTDSSEEGFLRIAVIDTGIGISPDNIKKLFQPFMQIDSALNRQFNGTGLGLVLVKQIVELHGGSVELTSDLGVGSCFTLMLPCNPSLNFLSQRTVDNMQAVTSGLDSETANLSTRQSPLLLLAEDNEANISTVSSYLEAKGYRILLARNGQEAVDLATMHRPDLILMDIQMPVMDGLEATKQIRLDPNLVNIPIIALTALAMTGDRDRCIAAGATDYLTKPVKLKQLFTTINQLLAT